MPSDIQVLKSNRKIRNNHIMGCNVIRLNGLFLSIYHNNNTPMQYTSIFHGCKLYNFQMKICNVFIFILFFAQNIDRGYTSNKYPRSMF